MDTNLPLPTTLLSRLRAPSRAGEIQKPETTVTMIAAQTGWQKLDVRELWKYRELLGFLIWRDVKVRYKQTVLGAVWALLQPVMMMIVFTVFFGRTARVDTDGVPYPLFVFAGLLPWTFFATAITSAASSVVSAERVITKIYFPRILIPFASVGAVLVDFAIAGAGLALMLVYYQTPVQSQLLWLPAIVVLIGLAAVGIGTLLSALNVLFRDFRYVVPFLVQLWLFATPTIYMDTRSATCPPAATVPAHSATAECAAGDGLLVETVTTAAEWVFKANPMTGVVAAFRACVVGRPIALGPLAFSAAMIGISTMIGCCYFRNVEDSFADVI